VDAYVTGWARSRRAPYPEPVEHGWYLPTGTPTEPERYVLTGGAGPHPTSPAYRRRGLARFIMDSLLTLAHAMRDTNCCR